MNSEKQYIFVNVRTPLEVKPDGTYHVIADRMIIDVEPCIELPPINTSENDRLLLSQIQSIIQSSNVDTKEPVQTEEPIKNDQKNENDIKQSEPKFVFNLATTLNRKMKPRQNITFRNKTKTDKSASHHYTRKNHNYTGDDSDPESGSESGSDSDTESGSEYESESGSGSESETDTYKINSDKKDADSVQ